MGFLIAGLIIGIVGTAISTYAAYSQAEAQQKAAKQEAQFREQEAESARQSAAYDERQYRRRATLLLGKQNAILGASGMDISSGSPLLLELDSVRQAELEALNIRQRGASAGYGREQEARLARMRAAYAGNQKGYAIAGGVTSASSSILGGWAKYNKKPGWGDYL